MSELDGFAEFVTRIRAGDATAAEELVQRYEPLVRREIRLRMVDSRLSRVYDSVDFSQAVLASFFLRAGEGEYELNDPQDLVRLLVTMARNKLASGARQLLNQKRDGQRRDVDEPTLAQIPEISETPSSAVELIELVEEAKRRLTDEERNLAELRKQGKSWEEIGELTGGSPQARRMQLARAFDRVSKELGIGVNESGA
jgi:RNA polymerase sigma factor (sigma-70 family)